MLTNLFLDEIGPKLPVRWKCSAGTTTLFALPFPDLALIMMGRDPNAPLAGNTNNLANLSAE